MQQGKPRFCTEVIFLKLYAISDLHLDFPVNKEALSHIPPHPGDWLITAGDLCTKGEDLRHALQVLTDRFERVFWVPGNHELWTSKEGRHGDPVTGEAKYRALVDICREFGVLTPEDPFVRWPVDGQDCWIAPLFIPYDYSFKPAHVAVNEAVAWAVDSGVLCVDEKRIEPTPFANIADWCRFRYHHSMARLEALEPKLPLVLINHFPLKKALVRLKRIPRFVIWCGTELTEDLHRDFPVKVVVSGHLHMRATDYKDGVRFEEVSLGYPRDWDQSRGMKAYFREILPGPTSVPAYDSGPIWRFF